MPGCGFPGLPPCYGRDLPRGRAYLPACRACADADASGIGIGTAQVQASTRVTDKSQ